MSASNRDIELFKLKFKEWRLDWVKFTTDVLRCKLDEQQQEILYSIQNNRRVTVCSGTARGKDFLAATASLCFLYLTPYWDEDGIFHSATVINTAPTGRQVKNIMMREMKSRYSGSILPKLTSFGFNSGRLVADGIKFDLPGSLRGKKEYANIEKWYLNAFKSDDNNPESWTGLHNTNIFIAVTEASGINPMIFDSIEGNLQGNSKLLLVFNPNNTTGEAFNSMRDPQYKSFRLSSLTSPNVTLGQKLKDGLITDFEYEKQSFPGQVDWEWVNERVHKAGWTLRIREYEFDKSKHDFKFDGNCYRPSDVAKIKILGVHPESSEDTLIPLAWIEYAQDRWVEQQKPDIKGIRGADIAGMGSDTSVFADRYDYYLDEMQSPAISDPNTLHMQITGRIKQDLGLFDSVMIDCIGEGAAIFSRLKEQGCSNVYNFKNSYGAKGLKDKTEARKFLNMRAYTHWAMRDWLDPQFDSKACLPPDDELKAQLTEIKYKIRSDGAMQIEEKEDIKKRLGVSPDKSDALAQTFAPLDRLIAAIEKKHNRVRPGRFGG